MARAGWTLRVQILEDQRVESELDALAEDACRIFACLEQWMRRIPADA